MRSFKRFWAAVAVGAKTRTCRTRPSRSVVDLADPEPQLAADAEPARTAALAAQVIQGLGADAELGGQLREGEDGAQCRRGARCGLHTDQVHQA